jgi:hypothetical protein
MLKRISRPFKPSNFSPLQLTVFLLAFALIGYLIFRALAAPNPNLPGDLNNDNTVNVTDLSILLSDYGTTNPAADINGDGTVNILDLSSLLSHYGQSVSTGTILEQINYDNPSPYGWTWQIQAGNYGFTDSYHLGTTFETVLDPNGGSRHVAHVHLPPSNTGRAGEGVYKRTVDLGSTDYYGLSIRVPVGWHNIAQDPNWHTLAAQFNYGVDDGPPISLGVQPNDLQLMMLTGQVTADASGNATDYEFQASPNVSNRLYLTQNLTALEGQWIDIIVEVKWATTWNGFVNAWIRPAGGSWTQAVDSQATFGKLVPTQQWETTPADGSLVDINGIDQYTGQPKVTTDKAGLYAGPGSTAMDIWESTFIRGTTFNVVANQLP